MQLKTSSLEFERFGSVYDQPVSPADSGMISRDLHLIAKRNLNQLYHFDCEVCLELQSGMAALRFPTVGLTTQVQRDRL